MKHYILPLALLTSLGIVLQSCNDSIVEPGLPEYPIELTVNSENSSASLNWTELTVSTFEEYIIVRSTDSIPDSSQPETDGNTTVIERIDKAGVTEFIDFATPISKVVYYKVFGKIGDRFLSSPTVRIDLAIQIIDLRADISGIDISKNEFAAYDRSNQRLFVANYKTGEIRVQKFINLSALFITMGTYNSADEIYVADQSGVMHVYDAHSLDLKTQSGGFTRPADFMYDKGRFIIIGTNGSISVMSRSNMQITDTDPGAGSTSLHKLYPGKRNGEDLEIIAIEANRLDKYILTNNKIAKVKSNTDTPLGGQLITAGHPEGTHFVINSFGKIVDNNLDFVADLEGGTRFYQQLGYTPSGTTLYSAGIDLNEFKLKFFDVEDNYSVISQNNIAQFPIKMFSDDENVYLLSIIFLNGGVRTLISNYKIP